MYHNSRGTMAETILLDRAQEYRKGFVHASVDVVMSHDATTSLIVDRFSDPKNEIVRPSNILFVADHFCAPSSIEHSDIIGIFTRFVREVTGSVVKHGEGICHQILAEDHRTVPGTLVVGADSHTVTVGALGCLATGIGSTDLYRILVEGATWFRVPESIRIHITGVATSNISGRDVGLWLLGVLGEKGATYKAIEFHDDASLSMDDRLAICNCVVEAGAKCGMFVPDEITQEYLYKRGAVSFEPVMPRKEAKYIRTITLNLNDIVPQVARPHSPSDVVPVSFVQGTPINRAFIGSCASGRLSDLRSIADVLSDHEVHPNVELVVIPASREVLCEALKEGIINTLVTAGAILAPPSCGPCGGISNGLLGSGDVCISTSTRNYRGRMGHRDSEVYLASARTVALSAIYGEITAE